MNSSSSAPTQRGFGLVELMISLSLGLVIILGITNLYVDSSRTLGDISRTGRQLETGLYALDLIADEIALAGYWGELAAPINFQDPDDPPLVGAYSGELMREEVPELPEVCVGTGGSGKDPNLELAFAMQTPLVSGLGAELNALLGSSWCNGSQASTPAAAEEFVAIRRASTCAAGSAADNNCPEIGDFFHLQVSGCSDPNNGEKAGQVKLERVTEATVNSVLNLRRFGCHSGASEPAPIYRYISRIYYVNQDDQLIRLQLEASGTYAQQVMAEGIEALRFEWLIDHDPAEKAGASSESGPNGTYDSIRSSSDDSWTALDRQTDWEHIVGARVWMVTRSVAPVAGYIDTNTYDIPGQAWSNDQPDHTRMLRSRTVDVVNTAGRRR